jgi:hypothetical protein
MATKISRMHLFCFATCAVIMFFVLACSNSNITDVKESKNSGGQVTLSWDFVYYAVFYNIYYGNAPGVTKNNGKKIANVNSPHTITGLERGKIYYFVVTASGTSGESKESEEISFLAK